MSQVQEKPVTQPSLVCYQCIKNFRDPGWKWYQDLLPRQIKEIASVCHSCCKMCPFLITSITLLMVFTGVVSHLSHCHMQNQEYNASDCVYRACVLQYVNQTRSTLHIQMNGHLSQHLLSYLLIWVNRHASALRLDDAIHCKIWLSQWIHTL